MNEKIKESQLADENIKSSEEEWEKKWDNILKSTGEIDEEPKASSEERTISGTMDEMCSLDSIGTFKNLLDVLKNGFDPDDRWDQDGLIKQNRKEKQFIEDCERRIEENNAKIELIDRLSFFLDAIEKKGLPLCDDWYASYEPKTFISESDINEIHFQMMRIIEDYAAFSNADANTVLKKLSFLDYVSLRDQVLMEMASIHKRKDIYAYGCVHEMIQHKN